MNVERQIEQRDNERRALELRRAGATYREIARALDCSVSTAHDRVAAAISAYLPKETVEAARAVELDRLDELIGPARDMALDADDGELRLKAIDRLLKIADRRAKLLGLDAPTNTKLEVTGAVTAAELDALIASGPDDADARG